MRILSFFFSIYLLINITELQAQQLINLSYTTPSAYQCSGLSMFTNNFGMVGANDALYRTFDAGQSWNPVYTFQNNNLFFDYVPNSNGSTIFAVDVDANLYKSSDYGNTWSTSIIDSNIHIRKIKCIDGSIFFAYGYWSFYKTTDGGATWTQIPGFYYDIIDIEFEDSLTGYASGFANPNGGGKLYKTIDGGNTWTNIFTTNLYGLSCLSIIDHDTILAGTGGGVLKINNSGTFWDYSYISPNLYTSFWDIKFENQLHGYACGSYGLPNSQSLLIETHDGGISWQSYSDNTAAHFREIEITSLGLYLTADSGRISNPTLQARILDFCPIDNVNFRHFTNSDGSLTVILPHLTSEIKVYDVYGTLVGQDNCNGGECNLNIIINVSGIYIIWVKAGEDICVYRQMIVKSN